MHATLKLECIDLVCRFLFRAAFHSPEVTPNTRKSKELRARENNKKTNNQSDEEWKRQRKEIEMDTKIG